MPVIVKLDADCLNSLDLSPVTAIVEKWLDEGAIATQDQQLRFEIDIPRDPQDPRELSEIPEIRLWFVRLDARYPWLPYVLDWEAGELGRYAAMLVPHQFSPTEGIQYNPEALEIFVMQKVFVLVDWMQKTGIGSQTKIKFMTQMLGYELDDAFFAIL
ncbi:MAG TPA: CRR6 family NdhI maturation factor [Crinalium sp.]|jgi:hypothetical protein